MWAINTKKRKKEKRKIRGLENWRIGYITAQLANCLSQTIQTVFHHDEYASRHCYPHQGGGGLLCWIGKSRCWLNELFQVYVKTLWLRAPDEAPPHILSDC